MDEVAEQLFELFGKAWSVGFDEKQVLEIWQRAVKNQEEAAEDHERRKEGNRRIPERRQH